jgi:hypothetical protein
MKTRLGNNLYWAGVIGAAICVLFIFDAISVRQSGESVLPISGRFLSHGDLVASVAIGFALALLSWRAGVAARSYVDKAAVKKNAEVAEMYVRAVAPEIRRQDRETAPSRQQENS